MKKRVVFVLALRNLLPLGPLAPNLEFAMSINPMSMCSLVDGLTFRTMLDERAANLSPSWHRRTSGPLSIRFRSPRMKSGL